MDEYPDPKLVPKLKVIELKSIITKLNEKGAKLKKSGLKSELITRILDFIEKYKINNPLPEISEVKEVQDLGEKVKEINLDDIFLLTVICHQNNTMMKVKVKESTIINIIALTFEKQIGKLGNIYHKGKRLNKLTTLKENNIVISDELEFIF